METGQSILTLKEYGTVSVHLRELLESRNMTRNQLARAVNTRFEVVNKWYSGQVEKLDADLLARFCFVLQCDVEDLIHYNVPKND